MVQTMTGFGTWARLAIRPRPAGPRKRRPGFALALWAAFLAAPGMAIPPGLKAGPDLRPDPAPARTASAPAPPVASVRPSGSSYRIPRLFAFMVVAAVGFTTGWSGAAVPPAIPSDGLCQASPAHLPGFADLPQCPWDETAPDAGWTAESPEAVPPAATEPSLVLALYHPALGGGARHFGYEVAQTGVKTIQVLGEGTDLASVALDGEVMMAAHGIPGHLSDGVRTLPMPPVLAALTDPRRGLPKGFHGTITIVACHAGEAPAPTRSALDMVEQYLALGGVSATCAKDISAALSRHRTVSADLLRDVRARLRTDAEAHPAPERRTEAQIMAVFTRIIEALHLDRGSVVRQIAAGLTAAGFEGAEVIGPVGPTMAFWTGQGVDLEVASPGVDPARILGLIHDLAEFHLGSSGPDQRARLLAMGVGPEGFGAGSAKDGRMSRRISGRPGADLVGHAVQWLDDYRNITRFAHDVLSKLDLTLATGQARAFLPHSERFARARTGAGEEQEAGEPGPSD